MNLENLNVQELNTEDQRNVDGGLSGATIATIAWIEGKVVDFIENGIVWP